MASREGRPEEARRPERSYEVAAGVGEERLSRSSRDILVTAVIGGVEVALGAIAAMAVLGASLVAFPASVFTEGWRWPGSSSRSGSCS